MEKLQVNKVVVSVIMSVYNEEKYIREAIDSILNQTFQAFELIIINDGSTDKTDQIISSYADYRIRYFNDNTNKNQAVRANEGIQLAKGKYIARMDGDDISLPNRLERQVEYLEAHPEIAILGTQIKTVQGTSTKAYRYKSLPLDSEELKWYALFFCPFIHSTVMGRKEIFNRYWYDPKFVVAQDFHLFSRMLHQEKGANLKEVLVHYRVHPANVHKQDSKRLLYFVQQIFEERCKLESMPCHQQDISTFLLLSESNPQRLSTAELLDIKGWLKKIGDFLIEEKNVRPEIVQNIVALIWRELHWKVEAKNIFFYLLSAIKFRAIYKLSLSNFIFLIKQFFKNL